MSDEQLEGEFQTWVHSSDPCYRDAVQTLEARQRQARENLDWLYENMPGYFFITMKNEIESMTNLLLGMQTLRKQRKIILADREKKLIVARLDVQGSLYDTLKSLKGRDISYAEITHSYKPIPGTGRNLEVLRFEFDPKSHKEISEAQGARLPAQTREGVLSAMKNLYPTFGFRDFNENLNLLWYNSREYVQMSPPERIARILWLYQQGGRHDGLFLDVEETRQNVYPAEFRILFAVENPPQQGFLTQAMEVFKRLKLGVRRAYSLNISNGRNRYFLGNFYVTSQNGKLTRDSAIFGALKTELYNTQILSTSNAAYSVYVNTGLMNGEDASLTNALAAFCQTTLGHSSPDRFSMEVVQDALFSHPDIVMNLVDLFHKRFDPDLEDREAAVSRATATAASAIENYNTGHKHLDEIRRIIYRTCLLFVTHTLKTNFFIAEKQALAFRLDPTYLAELSPEFNRDLPPRTPFRITFFFGRGGAGYHIGFSDIARGGWRTIICRTPDELTTNRNNLFREVFVLAHTQHLKNKDIYEGGSKLAVLLDARGLDSSEAVVQQLYKVQAAFLNAFLDIFITENGKARDPRVVDYYGDDEPIELGPDENMHDSMIELIALQAAKRGYSLGSGIMSSKRVGINHKQYGVTSRGVIRAAAIAMEQIGINIATDPFTVKITGGPLGDVAGNSLSLLLERCPGAKITCIIDASGAFFDPAGADQEELGRIVLKGDVHEFNPEFLHAGGCMLFSRHTRMDGLKQVYRKVEKTDSGLVEKWITVDEYYREVESLLFSNPVDLFLPCGGRPETVDGNNWCKLVPEGGLLSARVIVEGANSFITPEARERLQRSGVILIRDSSANKCGVITSSYEIIANLLMSEKEFLKHKDAYVLDVLEILDTRARDEANLIFRRHRESGGKLTYSEISDSISEEINEHYAKLFDFFQKRPELLEKPINVKVLLHHLPAFIRENPRYRARVRNIPAKIQCAILAAEIAGTIVYGGGWEDDFAGNLRRYLEQHFE